MTDSNTTTTTTTPASSPVPARDGIAPSSPEALAKAKADAGLISERDFTPIRVDVAEAAYGVLGSVPGIERHRAALKEAFGAEATALLDGLVPATRLVLDAQADFTAASEPDLEPIAQQLRESRDLLRTIAEAAVKRGIGDKKSLANLEGGSSYGALAADTHALAAWFQANREALGTHSKLTAEELKAIARDAEVFGFAVGLRDKTRGGSEPVAIDRVRAFTHFARTYDAIRKMVTFVRWHERDYDLVAPSIYAGRTRKDDDAPAVVALPANNIAPGLPGALPFTRPV